MLYLSTYKTGYKGAINTLAALIITTKAIAIMTDSNVRNSVEQQKEIWKDIEGYDGIYQVSNKGNVRSWKPIGSNQYETKVRSTNPKILSFGESKSGYHKLVLCKNGSTTTKRVNRLVAEAFISNPEDKPQVNHIDGDKKNNNVSNLEWVTVKENVIHAQENGLLDNNSGENHKLSKLTETNVLEIRSAYKLGCFSQAEISKAYDITQTMVSRIVLRKAWKHI